MPSKGEFAGKLAIITGSAKQNGIGYAIAFALAEAGADVCPILLYGGQVHLTCI